MPEKTIAAAGNILCMPSPAMVHKVDTVIRLEIEQPSKRAMSVDNIQVAPAAGEAGKFSPKPVGKKKAMIKRGTPDSSVGTSLSEIRRQYQIKYRFKGRHSS